MKLENENGKRQRWAVSLSFLYFFPVSAAVLTIITSLGIQFENSLRRHNHLGFLHALLLGLAKAGKLDAAKDGAKKAIRERRERSYHVMACHPAQHHLGLILEPFQQYIVKPLLGRLE